MNCLECGREIVGRRRDALFCCDHCRSVHHYQLHQKPARARLRICPRHPATRTPLTGFKQRICAACRAAHADTKARNQSRLRLARARRRELTALQQLHP